MTLGSVTRTATGRLPSVWKRRTTFSRGSTALGSQTSCDGKWSTCVCPSPCSSSRGRREGTGCSWGRTRRALVGLPRWSRTPPCTATSTAMIDVPSHSMLMESLRHLMWTSRTFLTPGWMDSQSVKLHSRDDYFYQFRVHFYYVCVCVCVCVHIYKYPSIISVDYVFFFYYYLISYSILFYAQPV